MTYRISTVAEMTGIPRNTLIAWERRYGLLRPERQANGYRRYSEQDVAQLLRVKNALTAGLKISEAVALLKNESPRVPVVPSPPVGAPQTQPDVSSDDSFVELRRQLVDALINYRSEEAQRMMARLVTVAFSTRLHQIYFPVLRDVGELWERGEISIAQEHFASGLIKAHLAAIFVSTGHPNLDAPHVVVAAMPREEHEIAALALAIQLSLDGHRVTYLGAKMPVADLVGFCEKQSPHLVCISAITMPSPEDLQEFASSMAPFAEKGTRIVLGGECLRGIGIDPRIEICPSWTDFQPGI